MSETSQPDPTVCPTPRTWPAVQDFTDAELNLAIAELVCGWVPVPVAEHARTGCTHWAPDGGLHLVPDYTGSWEALMPVWFSEGMTNHKIHLTWWDDPRGVHLTKLCTDETMLRRAIAEEVLWLAVQPRLHDVKLYDRALSASEVAARYEEERHD